MKQEVLFKVPRYYNWRYPSLNLDCLMSSPENANKCYRYNFLCARWQTDWRWHSCLLAQFCPQRKVYDSFTHLKCQDTFWMLHKSYCIAIRFPLFGEGTQGNALKSYWTRISDSDFSSHSRCHELEGYSLLQMKPHSSQRIFFQVLRLSILSTMCLVFHFLTLKTQDLQNSFVLGCRWRQFHLLFLD